MEEIVVIEDNSYHAPTSMSIETAEDNAYQAPSTEHNTRQTLLSIARKVCHEMKSPYRRKVYEINGVKYDLLCKKKANDKYYAEVCSVHDDEFDDFTLCNISTNHVIYQLSHDDLK